MENKEIICICAKSTFLCHLSRAMPVRTLTKGASPGTVVELKVDLIDNESKILVNTSSVASVESPMSLGSNVFPPRVCNYNL